MRREDTVLATVHVTAVAPGHTQVKMDRHPSVPWSVTSWFSSSGSSRHRAGSNGLQSGQRSMFTVVSIWGIVWCFVCLVVLYAISLWLQWGSVPHQLPWQGISVGGDTDSNIGLHTASHTAFVVLFERVASLQTRLGELAEVIDELTLENSALKTRDKTAELLKRLDTVTSA